MSYSQDNNEAQQIAASLAAALKSAGYSIVETIGCGLVHGLPDSPGDYVVYVRSDLPGVPIAASHCPVEQVAVSITIKACRPQGLGDEAK